METLTHGFEGQESFFESKILNRAITIEQQNTKMENLTTLAKQGFRVIRAIQHGMYWVKGTNKLYYPYTNEWKEIFLFP